MKLSNLIRQFLEYCEIEKGHSALTVRNYEHYLNRFQEWAGDIGPEGINLEQIRQYRLFLNRLEGENGNLKKATQNYHMIALRAFLKYLAKMDIKSLSAEKIELADAESRSLTFLESDELARLLEAPEKQALTKSKRDNFLVLRDKAILETLFSTGLRVSELVGLNTDQINIERGEFGVRGKGGKIRIVFLSNSAVEILKKYLTARNKQFKPLFIRTNKYSATDDPEGEKLRLTSRTIQRLVKKYARIAGIVKDITPHGIRHSFATDLLISGADIRSVQTMLGHSSITTTQIYTHVTNPQLRKIHEKFHGKSLEDKETIDN